MEPRNQLLLSQQKLVDTFLACAGKEYIGKTFLLNERGKDKIKHFSCDRVGFSLDISDSELFSLARHGYLQIHTDPPAVIFTEKTLERIITKADLSSPSETMLGETDLQILKVDMFQLYAWFVLSLLASVVSLYLLIMAIQQVLNSNLTIGILSGLSTVASGFVTTLFYKNYDKANERLKYLRSKSSIKKGVQK